METILKNEELTVTFATKGGTMTSIKDKTGLEYLWQGDAAYWSGQAPILFPICGSIRDDQASVGEGNVTKMPRHGLIRKLDFTLEEQTADSVTYSIESNEELKKAYPYDFKVYASYRLMGKKIEVIYEAENRDEKTMPFFFGGHPGFCCPIMPGESYDDYYLEFEKEETCTVPTPVTETGLIDMEHRTPCLNGEKILRLKHELFHVDAIIFDELKSRSVSLKSDKSAHGVRLDFTQFPYLIAWSSANDGDFVALEPWLGLSTCSDEDDVLEHKRNVQYAAPGEKKSYQFDITLL